MIQAFLSTALEPSLTLFAQRNRQPGGMAEAFKTAQCLGFLGEKQQGLEHLTMDEQLPQDRFLLLYRIGPDNEKDDLPGKVPEVRADGVFVVPAELSHGILQVQRQRHRLLVNREMLIPGHVWSLSCYSALDRKRK